MSTPENPPAFPIPDTTYPNGQVQYGSNGMTLRDFFAAMQLAGACANPMYQGEVTQELSDAAFRHADAMLRARNRAGEEGR